MTLLHDPIFLTQSGDAQGGRVPVQVKVNSEGGALSVEQVGGMKKEFSRFTAETKLSVAPLHERRVTLADGSQMSMRSVNGQVSVEVWPKGKRQGVVLLPHGFGVVMRNKVSCVYGRVYSDGITGSYTWKVTYINPPQLKTIDANSTYSVKEEFVEGDTMRLRPHLLAGPKLWEFDDYENPSLGGAVVAYTPTYLADGLPASTIVDFVSDLSGGSGIFKRDGTLLKVGPTPTAILYVDDPEPTFLLSDVTMDENYVVMQAYRKAVVSLSMSLTMYRYVAEVYYRDNEDEYKLETNIDSVWFANPGANMAVGVESAGGTGTGVKHATLAYAGYSIVFGPERDDRYNPIKYCQIRGRPGSGAASNFTRRKYRQVTAGSGTWAVWLTGIRDTLVEESRIVYTGRDFLQAECGDGNGGSWSMAPVGYYDASIQRKPEIGTNITIGCVGGRDHIHKITLDYNVAYPVVRHFFRNGTDTIYPVPPTIEYGTPTHYWSSQHLQCINSEHWVESILSVALAPPGGWGWHAPDDPDRPPVQLFGGTVKGTLVGRHRWLYGGVTSAGTELDRPAVTPQNSELDHGGDGVDVGAQPPGVAPGVEYTYGFDYWDLTLALHDWNTDMIDWYRKQDPLNPNTFLSQGAGPPYPNPETVDYNPNGQEPEIVRQLVVNKVQYALDSLYITDFDLNARFYAGIKVEVKCENYEAVSLSNDAPWVLVQRKPAKYTVKISFITCWLPEFEIDAGSGQRVETSTNLYVGTPTERPPYECVEQDLGNPWTNEAGVDFKFRMPPNINCPPEFYTQMANIVRSQGKNPHFVGGLDPDRQFGTAAWKTKPMQSADGVEFSVESDAGVPLEGLSKFGSGMLYARDVKISDFPDALWLLTATKCDAFRNDNSNDLTGSYFYMRGIKDAIDAGTVERITLRDGVKVDWTVDIPDDPETPAMPSGMEEINLYKI